MLVRYEISEKERERRKERQKRPTLMSEIARIINESDRFNTKFVAQSGHLYDIWETETGEWIAYRWNEPHRALESVKGA